MASNDRYGRILMESWIIKRPNESFSSSNFTHVHRAQGTAEGTAKGSAKGTGSQLKMYNQITVGSPASLTVRAPHPRIPVTPFL